MSPFPQSVVLKATLVFFFFSSSTHSLRFVSSPENRFTMTYDLMLLLCSWRNRKAKDLISCFCHEKVENGERSKRLKNIYEYSEHSSFWSTSIINVIKAIVNVSNLVCIKMCTVGIRSLISLFYRAFIVVFSYFKCKMSEIQAYMPL